MARYDDLLERLAQYNAAGSLPMHMPGHKRTALGGTELPWHLDITEIDGFDNLHEAEGILKDGMELAARLYGSARAFYLVNGSSGGILAAMAAAAPFGSRILMARGCHKSVYHAVELLHLEPFYLMPPVDPSFAVTASLPPEAVESGLAQHSDIRLVVLTSPTYEGVISDIAAIAAICHRRGIPLLVDEAHGAHLYFHPAFSGGAVTAGADLVIQSVHKTLPSLTQTALAHVQGDLVDSQRLAHFLAVFQTSSPSYLLMGSIHRCLKLLEHQGPALFADYAQNLQQLDQRLRALRHLRVLCHGAEDCSRHPDFFAFDPGKLFIDTQCTDLTGPRLAALLRQRGVEPEMTAPQGVLAMTSCCDTAETLERFGAVLLELDSLCRNTDPPYVLPTLPPPPVRHTIAQARQLPAVPLPMSEAIGRTMAESLWIYPPGIPLVVPGEVLTEDIVWSFQHIADSGVQLHSDSGLAPHGILVTQTR
ncbi:aminotransferase class I/II-fold pyridoxal phosphate-dependent enzyme [Candidatus Avoscillospira sp. LCP25S3_F1]|uniref:aminotransferase class I/II-fold pyridoxal phosphate-dependent enzyme n=1 Tax=Candidatus Avoscillospira sp. LCP25S3_F1 TaxID=3438825 RepID=UPI003F9175BB